MIDPTEPADVRSSREALARINCARGMGVWDCARANDGSVCSECARGRHVRIVLAHLAAVAKERDELRAALLNERGEGEPPSEGWAPDDVTPGRWEHRARGWCCYRIKSREYIVVERGSLSGELAREMTAREAMKAADTALAGGKS